MFALDLYIKVMTGTKLIFSIGLSMLILNLERKKIEQSNNKAIY